MNRGDAIQEIADRLGSRTDLNTRILNSMGYVQEFILEKQAILPWFLITENLYADTVADEPKLSLPTGFLREVEQGALWRKLDTDSDDDEPWRELIKRPHDELREALGDELDWKGAPTHYAILGNYWILAPVPDAVYRIYTRIYQADTLPKNLADDSATNQWLSYEAEFLISETVLRLGRHLQYPTNRMQVFQKDRDAAFRQFFITHEAREHANTHYRMGIARGN